MTVEVFEPRPGALLRVEHLVQSFKVRGGTVHAVSDVSFDLLKGEILGLVGESGCGKSSTGRAILQLPPPTAGSVVLDGQDLSKLSGRELRRVRSKLQIVFQHPAAALNPRRRVRDLVAEGLAISGVDRGDIAQRVDAALHEVGLDPDEFGDRRPHELSGGQCQRVAIARAMVLQPSVIVCDEPVASLDVSIQAQVLNLLEQMRRNHALSLVFIAHDLAVIRNISDRIAVMYLGKIVEIGDADVVYSAPAHPYTQAMLESVPVPDPLHQPAGAALTGDVPSPLRPPSGCRFRTRCPRAASICAEIEPPLVADGTAGRKVACHFPLTRG